MTLHPGLPACGNIPIVNPKTIRALSVTLLVLLGAFTIRAWWVCSFANTPEEDYPCVEAFFGALPWTLLLLLGGSDDKVVRIFMAAGTTVNIILILLLARRAHRRVKQEWAFDEDGAHLAPHGSEHLDEGQST